jgi:N-ethylmaleimide reductase
MRAGAPDNVPTELSVEYYRQRASTGGLIISEASQVSPTGQGYPTTPGIHSAAQVAGWKKVVEPDISFAVQDTNNVHGIFL